MSQYAVIATEKRIVAVNPVTKYQMQVLRSDGIIDLHVSNRGIFHAERRVTTLTKLFTEKRKRDEDKKGGRYFVRSPRSYTSTSVMAFDSCSGVSIRTFYPKDQRKFPYEEREIDLNFSFEMYKGSLIAKLNDQEQILFPTLSGEVVPEGTLFIEGHELYACRKDGSRIARVARMRKDEIIIAASCVDARAFQRMTRIKNKRLHEIVMDCLR